MILIIVRNEESKMPKIPLNVSFEVRTLLELESIEDKDTKYDSIIILGGDGTILRAIAHFVNVPQIFAFNFGTLGYLTTFPREYFSNLQNLLDDKTNLAVKRKRLRLSNGKYFLNEAVFTSHKHRLNTFVLTIDNVEFTFRGDALIIATQTGSTGYNHSVGGPILLFDGIVISLVAPNKCNFSPIVVDFKARIHVKTAGPDALVIADGIEYSSGDMSVCYDGNELQFVCKKGFNTNSFFKKMICNEIEIKM